MANPTSSLPGHPWRRQILALLCAVLACPTVGLDAEDSAPQDPETLQGLLERRDYFALRDHLAQMPDLQEASSRVRFFEAATLQAFNQPAASSRLIRSLLSERDQEPDLTLRLHHLQLTNQLRLHRYGEALESARIVLAALKEDPESPMATDVRGKLPLLQALTGVPPQTTEIGAFSRLALGKTRRVPLKIQGTRYSFALDTGANFSVIMRSEAQKLGLEIRPADLVISTSTARKVVGDVTVAAEVEIGNVRFSHVVFLVLPDEVLSFPDGQRIPGLVGFPLVNAMGEVKIRRDDVLEIPRDPQPRPHQNLALHDLDPLTRVRYGKEDLLCRLDTGAGETVFYEPFYRRFQDRIESLGHRITARPGGVGGRQEIPAFRLPTMSLTVASAGVDLRRVEVYAEPIRPPQENYLDCNLGLDVLEKFGSYTMSLRDMALVLD